MSDTPFVGDNDHGDAVPTPHDVVIEQIKSQRDDLLRRLHDIKEGFEGCCHACEPVGSMNQKLREERDEARRWVCIMKAQSVTYAYSPEHFAEQHGWDCFDGMPNPWSQKGASDE